MSNDVDLRQAIDAARGKILAQLKSHAPTAADLTGVKEADLQIDELSSQGGSRITYAIRIKDHTFVLSVHVPRHSSRYPRGNTQDISAFRRHLHSHDIPVAEPIGDTFTLPKLGYDCELSMFVHGYQPLKTQSLSETELDSFGPYGGQSALRFGGLYAQESP